MSRTAWAIAALFALALFMGSGPGIALVNEPRHVSFGGGLSLPWIYAWGLLWYLVEVLCVVLAYFFVWRDADGDGG